MDHRQGILLNLDRIIALHEYSWNITGIHGQSCIYCVIYSEWDTYGSYGEVHLLLHSRILEIKRGRTTSTRKAQAKFHYHSENPMKEDLEKQIKMTTLPE